MDTLSPDLLPTNSWKQPYPLVPQRVAYGESRGIKVGEQNDKEKERRRWAKHDVRGIGTDRPKPPTTSLRSYEEGPRITYDFKLQLKPFIMRQFEVAAPVSNIMIPIKIKEETAKRCRREFIMDKNLASVGCPRVGKSEMCRNCWEVWKRKRLEKLNAKRKARIAMSI
jgi:hypothetical protein